MVSSKGFQQTWEQIASEEATADKLKEAYERFNASQQSEIERSEFMLALSKHRNTPSDVLEDVLKNNPTSVYALEIAQNPNVSEMSLLELSQHQDPAVRYEAATKTQSYFLLDNLSRDLDANVRAAAGRNEYTSQEALKTLANDKDFYVRSAVGGNEKASPELLSTLALDSESQVVRSVGHNQSTPETTLKTLSQSNDELVRHSVAGNKKASEAVLDGLVKDPSASVRTQVAKNQNTSKESLSTLSEDKNRTCKYAAQDSLSAREEAAKTGRWASLNRRTKESLSFRGETQLGD